MKNKEITFLIWLYDRELKLLQNDDEETSWETATIREKFADFFGLNNVISELKDNG